MKKQYEIELFEEYDNINLYTIRYKGEEYNEAEKFINKFSDSLEYKTDLDVILSWIERISNNGALERYFKPEGKYRDGVCAIPIAVGIRVRLYCLRITDNILIIGNGDVKDAATWQESSILSPYVNTLINVSKFIHSRIRDNKITLNRNIIIGNLNFIENEKE